jgi:hypothetical protein
MTQHVIYVWHAPGLPCSKGMLVSTTLGVCYPPSSSDATSCSCRKTLTITGPTCDDMHMLIIKEFDSRIKGKIFKLDATVLFNIFHG